MAATTDPISGELMLLKIGGNAIGCDKNATLNLNQSLNSTTGKCSSNWQSSLPSSRNWSINFESFALESSANINGSTLDLTVGGTSLKGMSGVEMTLSAGFGEMVNSTTGLDREIIPNPKGLSLRVDGTYFDPAGTGADVTDDILDELRGATSSGLSVVASFGSNQQFSFTARPSQGSITGAVEDIVKNGFTLESTGAVTPTTTGADTGYAALISAWSGGTGLTALFGTVTDDNTEYTGTVHPSSINISVPYAGVVNCSGTLEGDGALTPQITGA